MNLVTQLTSLVAAVQQYDIAKQRDLDAQQAKYERLSDKNKRQFHPKKVLARAEYQKTVLATLKGSDPLNSVTVGAAMSCGRLTAYKRLVVLEEAGLVVRIGAGTKTKWSLK